MILISTEFLKIEKFILYTYYLLYLSFIKYQIDILDENRERKKRNLYIYVYILNIYIIKSFYF